jgi:hypothetical protein
MTMDNVARELFKQAVAKRKEYEERSAKEKMELFQAAIMSVVTTMTERVKKYDGSFNPNILCVEYTVPVLIPINEFMQSLKNLGFCVKQERGRLILVSFT